MVDYEQYDICRRKINLNWCLVLKLRLALIQYYMALFSLPWLSAIDAIKEILPYLEYQPLYAKIKHDQPWDSAANLPITGAAIPVDGGWIAHHALAVVAARHGCGIDLRFGRVPERSLAHDDRFFLFVPLAGAKLCPRVR